jgi:hypothetical protein
MESHVCTAGVHIFDSNNTVAVDKLMLQDGRWKIGGWEVGDWGVRGGRLGGERWEKGGWERVPPCPPSHNII